MLGGCVQISVNGFKNVLYINFTYNKTCYKIKILKCMFIRLRSKCYKIN